MSKNLRTRVLLGAMMFFQYAAWGAWAPVLGATLGSETGIFKAPGAAIGAIFGILGALPGASLIKCKYLE